MASFTLQPIYPKEKDPGKHGTGGKVGQKNRSRRYGKEKIAVSV
jgi:hypothetical protein